MRLIRRDGRVDEARAVLPATRAAVEAASDARATFTLRVAESALEYTDDRFGTSLELITSEAMKVVIISIPPWAKLTIRVAR